MWSGVPCRGSGIILPEHVLIFDELSLVTEKEWVTIIRHMHCGAVHHRISNLDPLRYSACGRDTLAPRIVLSRARARQKRRILCITQHVVK